MVDVPDFDALYRADPDPWKVGSSFYEQRKLAVLLACLTRRSYVSAWDPSCGTGELAAGLALRADTVVATDSSEEAVRLTATRCSGVSQVTVARVRQPGRPPRPAGDFALTVIAEFAYYLTGSARDEFWTLVDELSAPTAEIVVIHWRHRPHDGYLSGADVNLEAIQRLTESGSGWTRSVHHDDADFVLDVLVRG